MIKKIGDYLFWSSVYSPENGEISTASLSSDGDTNEFQLVINLGTKDKRKAPKLAEKILRALARKTITPMDTIWRTRFEVLCARIQDAVEEVGDYKRPIAIPAFPISSSAELFISNDWDICDNELHALENWGPGKFQRWVPCQDATP